MFSDEFNGTSIDRSKWEPGWFDDTGYSLPVNTDEAGCYHPSQVRVRGGQLELEARANTSSQCRIRDGSQAGYVSGLINTRNSFTFTYGYTEARMYLPGANNLLHNWPAVWTNGSNWPATGEIDIMEGLSTHKPCFSFHWSSGGSHRSKTTCVNGGDPTGWHTFGADWQPGRITFYYDGVEVGSYTEGVTDEPHYVIVNYGLTESHGVTVPSTVLVDYVRVWQRP